MDANRYLRETRLLDFSSPLIARLVEEREWGALNLYERIGAAYNFVKDEIAFGYNSADNIPASRVMVDGYGQCNTKATLLMALLRRMGAGCVIRAFAIDKRVQKGVVPALFYALAPKTLLHTWVEVEYEGAWTRLEGVILDGRYLKAIQEAQPSHVSDFCGYGVATSDLRNPPVSWKGADTCIQKEAIVEDYGVFDSPDELYQKLGANLGDSFVRGIMFEYLIRRVMNARVKRIREGRLSASSCGNACAPSLRP